MAIADYIYGVYRYSVSANGDIYKELAERRHRDMEMLFQHLIAPQAVIKMRQRAVRGLPSANIFYCNPFQYFFVDADNKVNIVSEDERPTDIPSHHVLRTIKSKRFREILDGFETKLNESSINPIKIYVWYPGKKLTVIEARWASH